MWKKTNAFKNNHFGGLKKKNEEDLTMDNAKSKTLFFFPPNLPTRLVTKLAAFELLPAPMRLTKWRALNEKEQI